MPRYKLTDAREAAKLTQEGLADLVGAERKAVNHWERGKADPREVYRVRIRENLDHNTDPDLFTNYPSADICQNFEPFSPTVNTLPSDNESCYFKFRKSQPFHYFGIC